MASLVTAELGTKENKIMFKIGHRKFQKKEFYENEEITLYCKKSVNMYVTKQKKHDAYRNYYTTVITFIENNNNKFKKVKKYLPINRHSYKNENNIYKCISCDKIYSNSNSLSKHKRKNSICKKVYDDVWSRLVEWEMSIEDFKNQLKQEYNIVENQITLTAKQISKLTNKELELFYYKPSPIIYDIHDIDPLLDIDPYYLGFWLGDGHSACGGKFTIGKQDQEVILPYMKNYANMLGLKFVDIFDKTKGYAQDFSINAGIGAGSISHSYMNEDWEETIINACKKFEVSKNTKLPYDNFQYNYDPFKEYLQDDGNYHIGNYSTKNNYNLPKKNGKVTATINQVKQYRFRQYLKKYMPDKLNNYKNSNQVWKDMTDEEKSKWKLCDNKLDIIKNTKYLNEINYTLYYKIYKEDGEEGIRNYKLERLKSMNTLTIWFNKYNLINNKHIPERYLKGSLSDRKKLFAGLIDSDGYHPPNYKIWEFTQSKKHIRLINDMEKLATSLGYYVLRSDKKINTYTYKGEVRPKEAIRLRITAYYNYDAPILLERKQLSNNWEYNGGGNYLKITK